MPESKRRNLRKAASNGQPTEEYKRFEAMMRRLVRTPKKAIEPERERKRA